MYNCHKILINGRLRAIVHTELDAENLINMLLSAHALLYSRQDFRVEGAYVENIGF